MTGWLSELALFVSGSPHSRLRQLAELRELDDHLLRDIGLSREEARSGRSASACDDDLLRSPAKTGRFHGETFAMPCLIRNSTEADVTAVHTIYGYHVLHGTASFEEQPPSTSELARRRDDVLGRGLPYLIAEIDGEVVGYSYAGPYRARSAYRFSIENSVYVDHRRHHRGVGQALMEALIERCEAGAWRQMMAVIGDSANIASIALHERLGFRMVGTFRSAGFKFGRWLDTVLMQRDLGAGDRTVPLETTGTGEGSGVARAARSSPCDPSDARVRRYAAMRTGNSS
jgi:L-amino acid N-acyltransferase YncA